jgi:integrase
MAVRMVALRRDPKTGSWKSRKVIPEDVRDAYGRANETPTWPATLTTGEAKAAWSTWLRTVEERIERLRRIVTATPIALTEKETAALAREWYVAKVAEFEDDPGDIEGWRAALADMEPDDDADTYSAYQAWLAETEARRAMGVTSPPPYDGPRGPWRNTDRLEAEAKALAEARGLVLNGPSHARIVDQIGELYRALCHLMIRRCEGDWTPDRTAERLPIWTSPVAAPQQKPSVAITELFDGYVAERKPAPATVKAWTRFIAHLVKFIGSDDAAAVSPDDALRWKDALLQTPKADGGSRSAKTVRDTYLAAARTVFAWGTENRRISANPFSGIKVRGPKRERLRGPGLTDQEAETILLAALQPPNSRLSPRYALAVRWVPWLCAYTGARVGEMNQLRKQDVAIDDGVWTVRITPEAGHVKTGKARVVPLHSHLLEQGFLEMVKAAKAGPLFYDPSAHRGGTDGNPQAAKAGERLAKWVRALGVDDPEVAPNHGWRHRFKTEMRRAKFDQEAREVLQGHAFKTEGNAYGEWPPSSLAEQIEKLPRYAMVPTVASPKSTA